VPKISVPTDIYVSGKFPTELKKTNFFIPGEFWKAESVRQECIS